MALLGQYAQHQQVTLMFMAVEACRNTLLLGAVLLDTAYGACITAIFERI